MSPLDDPTVCPMCGGTDIGIHNPRDYIDMSKCLDPGCGMVWAARLNVSPDPRKRDAHPPTCLSLRMPEPHDIFPQGSQVVRPVNNPGTDE